MTTKIRLAMVAMLVGTAVTTALAQDPMNEMQQQAGRQGARVGNPQGPPPQGQPPGPQGPKPNLGNPNNPGPNGDPMSPANVQQMFDALELMEAERFLPLTPEQYPVFVQKLKRVQEAKMQFNRRRMRAMNELRALGGPQAQPDVPDNLIDAKLKELATIELEGLAGMKKAQEDLEASLSVRQRARYRMLEENIERRKVEFLTKVRQGGGFEGIPQ